MKLRAVLLLLVLASCDDAEQAAGAAGTRAGPG